MLYDRYVPADDIEVLAFLKTRVPVYHMSNLFARDIQFALTALLHGKGIRLRYSDAEALTRRVTDRLEKARLIVRLDGQTWVVNAPGFKTPRTKPAPAVPGAAAPAPQTR